MDITLVSVFFAVNFLLLSYLIWLFLKEKSSLNHLEKLFERQERIVKEEIIFLKNAMEHQARQSREELNKTLTIFSDSTVKRLLEMNDVQKNQMGFFSTQLQNLTKQNDQRAEKLRETMDIRLKEIHQNNEKRLEQIRQTVDEKLQSTLEKRLGESFKLVSERLELVHKGLGEMTTLASGVGDLKKVLTNVKTRGIWGEIQLGNILEQLLTPAQYALNVATKPGSSERVEFAIKLPGKSLDENVPMWLPIDSKFPQDIYQRLIEAQENADLALIDEAGRHLEANTKQSAKEIRDKYIDPPNTTDFGIMFLPTEGLYAEILRRPGLSELLQTEFRIVIAGPTTLSAILNSLQMGFRTLAIEKRSSEVWALLGAVKAEFGKFGMILEKTQKKLQESMNTIEDAARKSRTIEKRLNKVEVVTGDQDFKLLDEPENSELIFQEKLDV